ncbi:MAG: TetR/AcrR family transcriptional regulator [Alicyclobacillus herbarius]|uniref:TetR/AcrR family transcriptional regulator n=1 Tax=Alicyclobacillus herbarius TaxID=122960 RepID=UPI000403C538|nr:TetR/AcrR family transcriptional regulator [Alicyclobacillus herbarius]MCL6631000.1 TetR/AcrR family transcriptional regulator [Alicyclobacillus herbarius]
MAVRGRRQQILEAASVLFSTKGYHGTTIRDIADESGLLSGSLYAHIRTKEDLLFEITNHVADAFLERLTPIAASSDPPAHKFRAALAAHVGVVAENLPAGAVFCHEWRALGGERRQLIQEKRDAYEQLWARIIEEGVENGDFAPELSRFSRIVTLSVANWLYQWYHPDGDLTPEEVSDALADVILNGLARRECS